MVWKKFTTGTGEDVYANGHGHGHGRVSRSRANFLQELRSTIQSAGPVQHEENASEYLTTSTSRTTNGRSGSGPVTLTTCTRVLSENSSITTKTEDVPTGEKILSSSTNENLRCEKINSRIFENTWQKFSSKHQTSPSHSNNNVQLCEGKEKDVKDNKLLRRRNNRNHDAKNSNNEKFNEDINNSTEDSLRLRFNFLEILLMLLRLIRLVLKLIGTAIFVIVIFYCLIALHKPSQAFISRNIQDLIYPFMRALRLLSLPVVKRLPILTDYYEESCLLINPFYETDNLDCWPCENVRHVIDLTGFTNFSEAYHHSGIPFIVKDAFANEIKMADIKRIYAENRHIIGKVFVETNEALVTTLDDVFALENDSNLHVTDFYLKWNINRVISARVWRKYFPKPYFIPGTTEVSVQHFLFVDRVAAQTYRLPTTEFANVFLTQASGSRSIVLIPTNNCLQDCKVVSVILQPKDVLFYNWLFWNPMSVSAADKSENVEPSVTFLGSFY